MRRHVLGVLTASVILVSGCSGSDSGSDTGSDSAGTAGAGTTSSPAATSSAPASPATSPSSDSTTAAPSSPGVAPATGPLVQGPLASVRAPADWVNKPTSTDLGGNVSGPTVAFNLALSDAQSASPDDSVDYLAKIAQQSSLYTPPLERRDDVVVAGQPAYKFSGNDSVFGGWAEEYGIRYQGHDIQITISTPRDLPQSERDSLAATILASVDLG